MSKKFKQGLMGLTMVFPSFLLLTFVCIVPIIIAIVESLKNPQGNLDFANYISLFAEESSRNNIFFTLKVTFVSVILILVVSYSLAVYLRFSEGFIANLIKKTYMIPIFIPGIIATYGIMNMYENHGWLAKILYQFGLESIPRFVYDFKGIILTELWFNIPFTTMLLGAALVGIQDSVIESAKDVGAGKLKVFFKFILPLSYQTMLVALTFIFMGVIGGFLAPYLIGPNSPQMLGVAMQQIFSVYQDRGLASANAVLMFVLSAVVGIFYIRTMIKDSDLN